MRVTLERWPHPLDDTRETSELELDPGAFVADLPGLLDTVEISGETIPRAEWGCIRLRDKDVVVTRAEAHDRNIAGILGLVAAIFIPGALGIAGTLLGSLVSAGIAIGVGLIFGGSATPFGGGDEESAEIYSITGSQNRARPYQPVPLLVGTHRMVPDLVAQPYRSYDADEEYYHLVASLGLGSPVIESVHAGNQDLADLSDAEYVYPSDGSLVSSAITTIDVGELTEASIQRTTPSGTTKFAVDLSGTLMSVDKKGRTRSASVEVTIAWSGAASGARTVTVKGSSPEPTRHSEVIEPGATGEYMIAITRNNEPKRTTRLNNVLVGAIRAFGEEPTPPANQNRIEFRIRASRQFTGALPVLTVVGYQPVPTWDADAGAWTTDKSQSSNPAAIFRWLALGEAGLFGGGIAAARINDAELGRWYQYCVAAGLRCDHVFRRNQTLGDALSVVARCGEGSWTWQGGTLAVLFDQATDAVSGAFSPENIIAGSMKVTYLGSPQEPDEVVGHFLDPDADWTRQPLRRRIGTGTGTPLRSVNVDLTGITTPAHAIREMNAVAARQTMLRRRMEWTVPREGMLVLRGSVAHLTHGLMGGGETGRLQPGSTDKNLILASEGQIDELGKAVTPEVGDMIELRLPDGSLVSRAVAAVPSKGQVTVAAVDNMGGDMPSVLWRLYAASSPPKRVRIDGIRRAGEGRFTLTGQEDLAGYFAALPATPAQIKAYEDGRPTIDIVRPEVASAAVTHVEINPSLAEFVLNVLTAGPWTGAEVTARTGFDPDDKANTGQVADVGRLVGSGRSLRWRGPIEAVIVTVTPFGGGEPHILEYDPEVFTPEVPDSLTIEVDGEDRIYTFAYEAEDRVDGVILRYGASGAMWDDMTPIHAGYLTESPYTAKAPSANGAYDVVARLVSTSGDLGEELRVALTIGALAAPTGLSVTIPESKERASARIYAFQFTRAPGRSVELQLDGRALASGLVSSPHTDGRPKATPGMATNHTFRARVVEGGRQSAWASVGFTVGSPSKKVVSLVAQDSGSGSVTGRIVRATFDDGTHVDLLTAHSVTIPAPTAVPDCLPSCTDPCFSPLQPVQLANGRSVAAGLIGIGDMVATPHGPREVIALTPAVAPTPTWQRFVRLWLNTGDVVVCTANHGFLRAGGDGWCAPVERDATQGRLFQPIVDVAGHRELWSRGDQPKRSLIEAGTLLEGLSGPVRVDRVEAFKAKVPAGGMLTITPHTVGGLVVVSGVVAAGGYSDDCADLDAAATRAAKRYAGLRAWRKECEDGDD